MRKILSIILALSLCLTAFAALAEAPSGLKLGLYVDTLASGSMDAEDDVDGLAQIDSVAVAVLVDADGKLVDVDIDDAQTKMPFTSMGELGADFPEAGMTKRELGNDYGMSAVSAIGDWDAQIANLCAYLVGKTADEIGGVALTEGGNPTDAELTAGCTMSVGTYVAAVLKAMENAVDCAASATDKVGLGVVTSTANSMDAMDDEDGLCEAYSYFAAAAVNESGVVTACAIDSTQGAVSFDAEGMITSDLTARAMTKREIGDNYGMKAVSTIGKEWYEQADGFAAYAVGKTVAELEGVAMNESGNATDAELTASVTLAIGDFKAVVLKAIGFAK